MRVLDIPLGNGVRPIDISMRDLIRRAENSRSSWIDLPDSPGIYVVYWAQSLAPEFQVSAGKAISANCARPSYLEQKWQFTCQKAATDIIYIGKGDNLRRRIRLLARFGVGKANNHAGGEWIWQIQEIETARLLVQTCPPGQQQGFENWLLESFYSEHGGFPLANRKGPLGTERWRPL